VCELAAELLDAGAAELVIADTIGAANPAAVRAMMDRPGREHGSTPLACHFHDTRALGLVNVFAAIESGVRRFDASVGGLGGCPFAPGPGQRRYGGRRHALRQMGFDTGIDMPRFSTWLISSARCWGRRRAAARNTGSAQQVA
jgi:hydroxymethylglutaryl-CoA lyase